MTRPRKHTPTTASPDYGREIFIDLGQIRTAWDDMLNPQDHGQVARTTGSDPARPPLALDVLSLRREVDEILAGWVNTVITTRQLTTRPATGDVPAACGFLMTHADWLGESPYAKRVGNDIHRCADKCVDVARGNRTRRYQVGRCPEIVIDDEGVEVGPCPGGLWALIREEDTMLPKHIQCDANDAHRWDPHQWQALGRRITPLVPSAVVNLVRRIAG